jgi:transposase
MIPESEDIFCGCFTDQYGFLLAKLLTRADGLDADLADLDAKLAELIAPLARAVQRPDEICGVGRTAAHLLVAELGTDTGQVPDRRAPGVVGQARPRGQRVRRQPQGHWLDRARQPVAGSVLGEAAVAASKTDSFLGERYRRIAR